MENVDSDGAHVAELEGLRRALETALASFNRAQEAFDAVIEHARPPALGAALDEARLLVALATEAYRAAVLDFVAPREP